MYRTEMVTGDGTTPRVVVAEDNYLTTHLIVAALSAVGVPAAMGRFGDQVVSLVNGLSTFRDRADWSCCGEYFGFRQLLALRRAMACFTVIFERQHWGRVQRTSFSEGTNT